MVVTDNSESPFRTTRRKRKGLFQIASSAVGITGITSGAGSTSFDSSSPSGGDAGGDMMTALLQAGSPTSAEQLVKKATKHIKSHRDTALKTKPTKWDGDISRAMAEMFQNLFEAANASKAKEPDVAATLEHAVANDITPVAPDHVKLTDGFFVGNPVAATDILDPRWSYLAMTGNKSLEDQLDKVFNAAIAYHGGSFMERMNSVLESFCLQGKYDSGNYEMRSCVYSHLPPAVKKRFCQLAGASLTIDTGCPLSFIEHPNHADIIAKVLDTTQEAEDDIPLNENDFLFCLGSAYLDLRTRTGILNLCAAYFGRNIRQSLRAIRGNPVNDVVDNVRILAEQFEGKMSSACKPGNPLPSSLVDSAFRAFGAPRAAGAAALAPADLTQGAARTFRALFTIPVWSKIAALNGYLADHNPALSHVEMAQLAVLVGGQLLMGTLAGCVGEHVGGPQNFFAQASGTGGFRYLQDNAPTDAVFCAAVINETGRYSRWHQFAAAVALVAATGNRSDEFNDELKALLNVPLGARIGLVRPLEAPVGLQAANNQPIVRNGWQFAKGNLQARLGGAYGANTDVPVAVAPP